jgi:alkylation response protein AidB-like acyl-CoA dehydrogenase
MDPSTNEEHAALRHSIVRFCRERLDTDIAKREREQTFPREAWRACGELGLQGLPVPVELGGSGLDPLATSIAFEAFGYGCRDGGLVFSVGAHLLACVVPIWKFGSAELRRRYLPGLCNGTIVAAHGMTEPATGSDAFAMRTKARADGESYVLNGTKTFVSNGPVADVALVFAITDEDAGSFGGISGFLVDRDTPGFQAAKPMPKMGLRTSQLGELVLEEVRVGADRMLGRPGSGSAMFAHAMDWERIVLAAAHVGTMQRILEDTIAYARTRTQSGQSIGKFQAVGHKIADMKIRLEASRQLVYKAARLLDVSKAVAVDAAIAKAFVSESLVKTALDAMQIQAGNGYVGDTEIERVLRDAVGSTIYSGTSEIQRNLIARWLGL